MYDDFKMMDEKQLHKALKEYAGINKGVEVLGVSGKEDFQRLLNAIGEVFFAIQEKFKDVFSQEFISAFRAVNIGFAEQFRNCYGETYIPNCSWKDITLRDVWRRFSSFLEELFEFVMKESKKDLKKHFQEYLKLFRNMLDFVVKI